MVNSVDSLWTISDIAFLLLHTLQKYILWHNKYIPETGRAFEGYDGEMPLVSIGYNEKTNKYICTIGRRQVGGKCQQREMTEEISVKGIEKSYDVWYNLFRKEVRWWHRLIKQNYDKVRHLWPDFFLLFYFPCFPQESWFYAEEVCRQGRRAGRATSREEINFSPSGFGHEAPRHTQISYIRSDSSISPWNFRYVILFCKRNWKFIGYVLQFFSGKKPVRGERIFYFSILQKIRHPWRVFFPFFIF